MKRWSIGAAVALCLGITAAAQAAGRADAAHGRRPGRPLGVEGAPQFGWMPAAKGNDVQTAYQVTVSKPDGTPCGTAARSHRAEQSYVPTAVPRWPTARRTWSVKTWDRTAKPRPPRRALRDRPDQPGRSGANWIRRATTGNDSSDDWTLARKQFPALLEQPGHAGTGLRARDGPVRHSRQRQDDRPWRQLELSDRGQYYAFDATDAVKAGQPVALGALYHYWTCTCQGRANGPVSNTTLGAAQAAGATNIRVALHSVFGVGDQITVGTGAAQSRHGHRDRHRRRGGHRPDGDAGADGRSRVGQAVLDYAGPTGLS